MKKMELLTVLTQTGLLSFLLFAIWSVIETELAGEGIIGTLSHQVKNGNENGNERVFKYFTFRNDQWEETMSISRD